MLTKILAFTLFFLSAISVYSQQWIYTNNGSANSDDRITSCVTDRSGNIYITGYVTNNNTGIDICTKKLSPAGSVTWTQFYNGPGNSDDKAFGIAVDNSGNVYVTGYSTGIGSLADYTLIKYNSGGSQQWVVRYNTTFNDMDKAFGIAVDNAGSIYITGSVVEGPMTDIYTIKYSSGGVYLWGHLFYGTNTGDCRPFGIAADNLNNIYITGYVCDTATGYDMATIKYDSSGNLKWSNIYNGNGNADDKAFGIAADNVNHFIYITGYSTDSVNGADMTTIKLTQLSGDTVWVKKFNGSGNADDKAFGIAVDQSASNVYITGSIMDSVTNNNYMTIKYDALTGNMLWNASYDDTSHSEDISNSIVVPKNGNYIFVTGNSRHDTSAASQDIVTLKYNIQNGEQVQENRYNGIDNKIDEGIAVTADTSGNIFVAGNTQRTATGFDWSLMKFLAGNIIGVTDISTVVPQSYQLYQNYPNPFNPSTIIKFDIKKASAVRLTVYDILGRVTAVLVNENLKPGSYESTFDGSNMASGIYFYRLETEFSTDTRKMILLK